MVRSKNEAQQDNIAEQNVLIGQNVNAIKDALDTISNLESLIESNKDFDDNELSMNNEFVRDSTSL